MALQDQPFKNNKKKKNEFQHTQNEDEFQINDHFLIKYNQPNAKIPTSNYKMSGTSVKISWISWICTIPFNFGYVHIINSDLNKCIY